MDIDEYQARTRDTATYPEAGSGSILAVNYAIMGMAGEAGEICNKWKKVLRGDYAGDAKAVAEVQRDLRKELGDVMWYASRLCEELKGEMGIVLQDNLQKLQNRKRAGTIQGNGDDR